MSAAIDYKIVRSKGQPDKALVDYQQFMDLLSLLGEREVVPQEVVKMVYGEDGLNPIKAWRIYRDLSQLELAELLGMSQPGLQQIENKPFASLRKQTRQKLATALGISLGQLDV